MQKIEQTLQVKVQWLKSTESIKGEQYFLLPSGRAFRLEPEVTAKEKGLVELLIKEVSKEKGLEELSLAQWLQAMNESNANIPVPAFVASLNWKQRVPFLLVTKEPLTSSDQLELENIINSYFEQQQAWMAPINQLEWLVLIPQSQLVGYESPSFCIEELLIQTAEGLAAAMIDELGIEVRIVVHHAISSPEEVKSMLVHLHHSDQLAAYFHPERLVHATWKMGLEQLLEHIEPAAAEAYLSQLQVTEMFQDNEMRKTIQAFFELNLNVSETARQLFIHRNTLLYRLDRLKQEIGLDVRNFEDAVLVKIALLLTTINKDEKRFF